MQIYLARNHQIQAIQIQVQHIDIQAANVPKLFVFKYHPATASLQHWNYPLQKREELSYKQVTQNPKRTHIACSQVKNKEKYFAGPSLNAVNIKANNVIQLDPSLFPSQYEITSISAKKANDAVTKLKEAPLTCATLP